MADTKKKKGQRVAGSRHRASHDSSPVKDRTKRFRIPGKSANTDPVASMLVRQTPVVVTSVEIGEWKTKGNELSCLLRIRRSDGGGSFEAVIVNYSARIREEMIEAVARGDRAAEAKMTRYLNKRATALQNALGAAQRAYGDLVPSTRLIEPEAAAA